MLGEWKTLEHSALNEILLSHLTPQGSGIYMEEEMEMENSVFPTQEDWYMHELRDCESTQNPHNSVMVVSGRSWRQRVSMAVYIKNHFHKQLPL